MFRSTVLGALLLSVSAGVFGDGIPVDGGRISGTEESGVFVYRGIPFAAPPVGDLRWKEPQPVEPWTGVRTCDTFGPICPQTPYPAASIYVQPEIEQSEDCLYLNIWTTANAGEKRPVMVWIHGGAMTRGAGSLPNYDGATLARKGVVLVTINYRLNVFGFMAHPELTAESPNRSSGNYAMLDQIAALQWVHRNIEQFGGDQDNVTIFGESAGSWSVHFLMASPLARGLFHKAIGQSGAAFAGSPMLASDSGEARSAEAGGLAIAEAAGAHSLAELRALSTDTLLQVYSELPAGAPFRATANVDNYVLSDSVATLFRTGSFNHVPIIVGSNADEMTSLTDPSTVPSSQEALDTWVAGEFGAAAPEYYTHYPAEGPTGVRDSYLAALRDRYFTLGMRTWAQLNTAQGNKSYRYYFTKEPPRPGQQFFKAFHAAEIAYVFGNLDMAQAKYTDADFALSDMLSSYWVNFASSGNPNGDGLPQWDAYSAETETYLRIGDVTETQQRLLKDQLDYQLRSLGTP